MNHRVSRYDGQLLWAIAIAFATFAGPAMAVERIHSSCVPKTIAQDRACTTAPHDYSLGPLNTTEFRGYCDADPPDGYILTPKFTVDSKDSGVSCTTTIVINPYGSMSCTNWSLTRHKSVSLRLECILKAHDDDYFYSTPQ